MKRIYALASIYLIGLSIFACKSVIAIEWKEIFFVLVFIAILFGPPLYRLIRRIERKFVNRNFFTFLMQLYCIRAGSSATAARTARWSLFVLLLSTLACRPMIAIGWEEFLFLAALMAFLLGPPLYRLMKRIENFRGNKRKDK